MNPETSFDANKDPDHLEREIDEQRREINETLRALEAKFTPEEIAGQVMRYFGGQGREWAANLGSSMKANPIPTLLTGVGVAWLMMSDRKSAYHPGYYYAGDYEGEGGGRFEGAADAVKDAAHAFTQKAGAMGDQAAHAREALGDKAMHAREALGDRAMHAREALRARASGARYGVRHTAATARERFTDIAQEQPLALGAVGIALGALLGAALPHTQHEDRMLGRASARVKERGKEMAREGYDKASQKAAEVADKAKDTLHRTMEQKHWQSDSGNSGADGRGDAPESSANVAGAAGQQPPQRAGTAPGA